MRSAWPGSPEPARGAGKQSRASVGEKGASESVCKTHPLGAFRSGGLHAGTLFSHKMLVPHAERPLREATRFSHRLLCPSALRWPQMVPEGRLQLAQSSVSLQAPVEEDNGCSQPALPAVEFHPVADSYFLQRVSTPHTARHPLRLSQRVGTRLRHQHRGVEAQSKSFLFGLGVSVPLWFQTGNKQRACHRYEPLFSRAFG